MSNHADNHAASPPACHEEAADLKERILLTAIDEFSRHGYAGASTNTIVASAGVSKGLLFHYYGNKKELFIECARFVFDKMESYILGRIDFQSDDIFDRITHSLRVKMQFCSEHPVFMGLAYNLWYSEERPLIEEYMLKHVNAESISEYRAARLFKGADMSKLNDGMDPRQVLRYTSMLLDTCWHRFATKYDNDPPKIGENTAEYITEIDVVLDLIKRGAYRSLD
jgi:AcrR family transcriptional regulator